MSKQERRKPSGLVKGFKEYNKQTLSDFLGIKLSEDDAWSLFRFIYRIPLRYLTSESEDFFVDNLGHLSIPLPSVGRFRIMATQPQGQKVRLVKEGESYPRYKFYPSESIESEVEAIYGLADEEGMRRYQRAVEFEEKARESIQKRFQRLVSSNVDDVIDDLEGVVEGLGDVRGKVDDSIRKLTAGSVEKEKKVKEVDKSVEKVKEKIVLSSDRVFDDEEDDLVAEQAYENIKRKEVKESDSKEVFDESYDFEL